MLSGDKMVEILRAVPPGIWQSYFGRGKLIYHKAIDDFIGKIEEFQDQIVTRIFPINGKFLLNNFEDLCQHLPQLMCSLVYIGRGDDGLILPIIEPEPLEKELSWEHLSFELIQRAEQSYFSYRRTLLSLIYQHKDRRLAYNDLMRQVRLFSDTQHYNDIRKVYWVLYLELMLEIRSFYEKRERNWALDCDLGKHSQLWLGLRSRDLPSMDYLSSTAVKEYLSGAVPQHRDALVGKIQSLMDEYERQLQPDGVQCVLGKDAPPDVDVLPTEAEHEGRGHPEIIQQEDQRPEYLFFQEGEDIGNQGEGELPSESVEVIEEPVDTISLDDKRAQGWARTREFTQTEENRFIKFAGLGIIAHSEPMLAMFNHIEAYAESDIEVLITGESGTGKEKVARAIHQLSGRSSGPFVVINCAGLTESILESELFGIEGQVATAISARKGKFESAATGTIFLDEIGDMPAGMQATILRALQEKKIIPVGAIEEIEVDMRIVSATNRELDSMVESKQFRSDLLMRINKALVLVPPLRERREDIPFLAKYFYNNEKAKQNLLLDIDLGNFKFLCSRPWAGNVRELESHIQLVATVLKKAGQGLTARELRVIITDPSKYLSGNLESDEPILRDKGDWDLLASFAESGLKVQRTAKRLLRNRDWVTRKISSICLRLGYHHEYDEAEITKYLTYKTFISEHQTDAFRNLLKKNWNAVLQFEQQPTTKQPYYADEKGMVQDLKKKRPDLI